MHLCRLQARTSRKDLQGHQLFDTDTNQGYWQVLQAAHPVVGGQTGIPATKGPDRQILLLPQPDRHRRAPSCHLHSGTRLPTGCDNGKIADVHCFGMHLHGLSGPCGLQIIQGNCPDCGHLGEHRQDQLQRSVPCQAVIVPETVPSEQLSRIENPTV